MDLEVYSNLRLGIAHKEDKHQCLGVPQEYNKEYEYHCLTFERYLKMPLELKKLKEKMIEEARND